MKARMGVQLDVSRFTRGEGGGGQSWSGRFEEDKNLVTCRNSNPGSCSPQFFTDSPTT